MSGSSSFPIRGQNSNTFYSIPYDGKDYDPQPQLQPNQPLWTWPEKEKIYRDRMAYARIGSKYDCRYEYPEGHCLNRSYTPYTPPSTSPRSRSSSGGKKKDILKEMYKRADKPRNKKKEHAPERAPEWALWVRDHVLQPMEDGIVALTSSALKERLTSAEKAYATAQQKAAKKIKVRRNQPPPEHSCPVHQPHEHVMTAISEIPGSYIECQKCDRLCPQLEGQMVCDANAAFHLDLEIAQRWELFPWMKGILNKPFLILFFILSCGWVGPVFAQASEIPISTSIAVANTTVPFFEIQPDAIPESFISVLLYPASWVLSFFVTILTATITLPLQPLLLLTSFIFRPLWLLAIELYITLHMSPLLIYSRITATFILLVFLALGLTTKFGCVVLYLLNACIQAVSEAIEEILFEGLITVYLPLALQCLKIFALRILVALVTPAAYTSGHLLYMLYRVVFFFGRLGWQMIGPPAILGYISRAWNSAFMHWACLRVSKVAESWKFWLSLLGGILLVDWMWLECINYVGKEPFDGFVGLPGEGKRVVIFTVG